MRLCPVTKEAVSGEDENTYMQSRLLPAVLREGPYLGENILHLHAKDQSVNDVQGNN
jgi:hypothetical protein